MLKRSVFMSGLILLILMLTSSTLLLGQDEDGDLTLDDVLDDVASFYDTEVTVEGTLDGAVSLDAFLLEDDDEFDPESVLVIYDTRQISDINVDHLADLDVPVRVTGTVQTFIRDELEGEVDFDLRLDLFEDYENAPVIIAESVTLLEEITEEVTTVIDNIVTQPYLYEDGISLEGVLQDAVSPRAFILTDDTGEVVVFYDDRKIDDVNLRDLARQDLLARVEGSPQQFTFESLGNMGFEELDIELFDQYENETVIVADSVTLLEAPQEGHISSTEDLLAAPEFYYGEEVTLRGDIKEALTTDTFLFESQNTEGNPQVLVFIDPSEDWLDGANIAELADESIAMELVGEVQPFDRLEIEDEYDLELDVEMFEMFQERPVVIAESITVVEELEDELNSIEAIMQDPELYYEQPIVLEEALVEAISADAFILEDDDSILVLYDTTQITDVNVVQIAEEDAAVRVTGTVREFIRTDVEDELDLELDVDLFDRYENQPVIIADLVELIDEVEDGELNSIDEIGNNADLFYGQTVTLENEMTQANTVNTFYLVSSEFLDEDSILVFYNVEDFPEFDVIQADEDNAIVRVTGIVREFSRSEFADEFEDIDFDDDFFGDYVEQPVIIAEEIIIIEREG